MKSSAWAIGSRWLLVLPVAFLASGATAWFIGMLMRISYAVNIVQDPSTIEKNLYAIAASVAYGWAMVSAGAATAPNHRPAVAVGLCSILFFAVAYMAYQHNTWQADSVLASIWAVFGLLGYLAGAAIAVRMVFVKCRRQKSSEAPK